MARAGLGFAQGAAALVALACGAVLAQPIVPNGLGTTAGSAAGAWTINGGTQRGGNLFHSFSLFGVNTGDSATFSGAGSVTNIVARVTGGVRSTINGQLGSDIAGANLWFINPSGITFGANSSLSLSGSFHASSANYVKLDDGTVFGMTTTATTLNSSLVTAKPEAFGFLNGQHASLLVHGNFFASVLLAPGPGATLSLVGGPVTIDQGAVLSSPAGRINIVAASGSGEVGIGASLPVTPGMQFADLQLTDSLVIASGVGTALPSGSINIRAGRFTLDNAALFLNNAAALPGGRISVTADQLSLKNGSFVVSNSALASTAGHVSIDARTVELGPGTAVRAEADGTGNAGTVAIHATQSIAVDRAAVTASGDGNAGSVTLAAPAISISGSSARIAANSFAAGSAGSVRLYGTTSLNIGSQALVSADNTDGAGGVLVLDSPAVTLSGGAQITADTVGAGPGGTLTVRAGSLVVDGATLTADAYDPGAAGVVNIGADSVVVKNRGTIGSRTFDSGAAGHVVVSTGTLDVQTGGSISVSASQDGGPAGRIRIEARDLVQVDSTGAIGAQSRIDASSQGASAGGRIVLTAPRVRIVSGGLVDASAIGGGDAGGIVITASDSMLVDGFTDIPSGPQIFTLPSQLAARTADAGSGGTVVIHAGALTVSNAGQLSASTLGTGAAGSVRVDAASVEVLTGATINADAGTAGGAGGAVFVSARDSIHIDNGLLLDPLHTGISADTSGSGAAGRVSVSAPLGLVKLENGGAISAFTTGDGAGGRVMVDALNVEARAGSFISAGTLSDVPGAGDAGTVTVTAGRAIVVDGVHPNYPDFNALVGNVSGGPGDSGRVLVSAPLVTLSQRGEVSSSTIGAGNAGPVRVSGGRIEVLSGGSINSSGAAGAGGAVRVEATESIEVSGSAGSDFPSQIAASASGTGAAGEIRISAPSLVLADSGIVLASTIAEGNAGVIRVDAGRIDMRSGGLLTSSSTGAGDAGAIAVYAGSLSIDGSDLRGPSGLFASTAASGAGGSVSVSTGALSISNGGAIRSRATETSTANAGTITISASEVSLIGNAEISVASLGTGTAGSILLDAGQKLVMDSSSRISATTASADAGDITIRAVEIVKLKDSEITTSAAGGMGAGGNIIIDPEIVLLDNSRIIANAFKGLGGNIQITSGMFIEGFGALVQASSEFGVSGTVLISSPRVDLSGVLRVLPSNYLDASSLLRASCASRAGASNSFIAGGRGGMAEGPAVSPLSISVAQLTSPVRTSNIGLACAF